MIEVCKNGRNELEASPLIPTTIPTTLLIHDKETPIKFDEGKLDWTLLPIDSLEDVVKVLAMGANKYNETGDGPNTWNWTKGSGLGKWRLLKSLFRHLTSYMRGETYDPESGVNHLAHVVCNCLFLLHYHKHPDKFGNMDN